MFMTTKTTKTTAQAAQPIQRGDTVIVRGGTYHGFTATFDHRNDFGAVVIMAGLVRQVPKVRRPGKW